MGILVLVLLVAAWGLVLGPALLRNTQDPSPLRTEMNFRRALKALGTSKRPRDRVGGRWVLVPRTPEYAPEASMRSGGHMTAADRRRRNLTILAGFIVVTFLLGLIPALRFLLVLNLVADVLLIAYLVAAMVYAARPPSPRRDERTTHYRTEMSPPEAAGGGW